MLNAGERNDALALDDDEHATQIGSQTDLPDTDMCFDLEDDSDPGPVPAMDCGSDNH